MKRYIVVARSRSCAIFNTGEYVYLPIVTESGRSEIQVTTRLVMDHGKSVPRGIFFECHCEANTVHDATNQQCGFCDVLACVIACSANAFVDYPKLELCFEITPSVRERDFAQAMIPDSVSLNIGTRTVKGRETNNFLGLVLQHKDRDRKLRALSHYRDMLSNWTLENRLRCLVHCFFAVEALAPAALRKEMESQGLSKHEIARSWGCDLTQSSAQKMFDGLVKRKLIFHDDGEVYKKTKDASDAFEHGYQDFGMLRAVAESIIMRSANHVRKSIFELCNLDTDTFGTLTSEPYDRPKGPPNVAHYVFGKLVGDGPDLAAPDQAFPILNWRYSLKPELDETSGDVRYTGPITITPRFASGISLSDFHMEVWDGSTFVEEHEREKMLARVAQSPLSLVPNTPETYGPFILNAQNDERFVSLIGRFQMNFNSLMWTQLAGADRLDWNIRRSGLPKLREFIDYACTRRLTPEAIRERLKIDFAELYVTSQVVRTGVILHNLAAGDHPATPRILLAGRWRGRSLLYDEQRISIDVERCVSLARTLFDLTNDEQNVGQPRSSADTEPR
jgi:hypothetical protein